MPSTAVRLAHARTIVVRARGGKRHIPRGLEPDFVRDIHRGPDGVIALARKHNGERSGWQVLGSIPVDAPLLPGVLQYLVKDGYFGVNSSYRKLRIVSPHRVVRATGLERLAHRRDTIRWLNVCYVDIDCRDAGRTVGATIGHLIDMQDRGEIPDATGFARSGTGVWVFWLLVDARNPEEGELILNDARHTAETPLRASRLALANYAKVQHALYAKLAHLGADPNAMDAARFGPFPGTTKSIKEGIVQDTDKVRYWWQGGSNGRGFGYTLEDLGDALDVPLLSPSTMSATMRDALPGHEKDPRFVAAGHRGKRARWHRTLGDLLILLYLRGGGCPDGMRHRGAFYYALLLFRNGAERPEVERELQSYASCCQPALSQDDVTAAITQAEPCVPERAYYLRHARLYADLRVNEYEASFLQEILATTREPTRQPLRVSPERRREQIQSIVALLGSVPSTRDMVDYLATDGITATHSTIALDYQALGLCVDAPDTGGRPANLSLF